MREIKELMHSKESAEAQLKMVIQKLEDSLYQKTKDFEKTKIEANEFQLELKIVENDFKVAQEKINLLQNEKTQLQAASERNNQAFQQQLETLRTNFEECVQEIDKKHKTEKMYKDMVSQLSQGIDVLKSKVEDQKSEQSQKLTSMEVTDHTLRVQLRLA